MSGEPSTPEAAALEQALTGALEVEFDDVDLEEACAAYADLGYEVTPWLREFIQAYSGVTFTWPATRGTWTNELTTSVDAALDVYPGNVRNYSRRLGQKVLPVGMAFATEDRLLLAENGDLLLGGDAGLQRIAHGFVESVRALISNDWDKNYL